MVEAEPEEAMNAPSAAWAVEIASQAATPILRLACPERALAASVIAQALADALGAGDPSAEDQVDARSFFRDWRLDAYCSILGLDATAVRERFERSLRQVRRGAVVAKRSQGTGMLLLELVA